MDKDNPLGLSIFDVADFLTSEERIDAYLEAAHEDDGSYASPAEHEAFIRRAHEDVARARTRWGLQ